MGQTIFTTSVFNTELFIGFISDTPFNKSQVREEDGTTNTNEYFQFDTLDAGASSVPEPQTTCSWRLF